MSDDMPTLALWPVAAGGETAPGAVVIRADCGHESWLSPASLRLTLTMPHRTICMACIERDGIPADATLGEVPGAREEIVSAIGEDATRHALAVGRRYFNSRRRR